MIDIQQVVTLRARSLESEVGGVLVRSVVPESEFDGTTVNTRAQAVIALVVAEPGNTAEELA